MFAWTPSDMPGIDPNFMCHRLSICPTAKPIAQRKRKMGTERKIAVESEVAKLLQACFIREIHYTTWLANVVMVKKPNGRWRMCTDYTNLNKACPKDAYPLPNIDRLVDGAAGHRLLTFLDAYSGYNQIRMHPHDEDKTAFITDSANYCYRVMPFGLKNAGATYQRLMDKVFKNQIGKNLEVYVDDMVVKSDDLRTHKNDLAEVFTQLRKHNMRLNPEKCIFGIAGGKFLGFMLSARECEESFTSLKQRLGTPPVLSKPDPKLDMIVYLCVSNEAISAVLVQETDSQKPIYFVSRMLQDAERRYQLLEKMALSLVHTARRLRQYFHSHKVIVRTDCPIAKVLRKPELAGRMMACGLNDEEANYVLREVHEGICGSHSGGRTLATKVLRAGYYWPTLKSDCMEFVKKCIQCQKHGNLIHASAEQLHSIASPWPFRLKVSSATYP
uniref:Transposon Ty3-I Gag-Pol polyprotein n=1 Tax=Cajanus cajan TaxID=3821 RepID=A0A151QN08_CAJCA|nr:Transposon Ty3-I Gag-Pol polyprotein [Cajanus cajan]